MSQKLIVLPKELPITSAELEEYLENIEKAEIIKPLRNDPIARKDSNILGIWVTV